MTTATNRTEASEESDASDGEPASSRSREAIRWVPCVGGS